MSSPKQLGAKQMFEQSLVYLYNSYREDGLSANDAKERVSMHIQEMQEKYQDSKLVPIKKKDSSISNPEKVLDEILVDLGNMSDTKAPTKLVLRNIIQKLHYLKKTLGGR